MSSPTVKDLQELLRANGVSPGHRRKAELIAEVKRLKKRRKLRVLTGGLAGVAALAVGGVAAKRYISKLRKIDAKKAAAKERHENIKYFREIPSE